jgi:hypothetical protein
MLYHTRNDEPLVLKYCWLVSDISAQEMETTMVVCYDDINIKSANFHFSF